MDKKRLLAGFAIALLLLIPFIYAFTFVFEPPLSSLSNSETAKSVGNKIASNTSLLATLGFLSLFWLFFKPPKMPVHDIEPVTKSRRRFSVLIDESLLVVSIVFFCALISQITNLIIIGEWQSDKAGLRDDVIIITIILSCGFAYRRLIRTLSQERPTIGQYLLDFRLVSDSTEHKTTSGRLIAAYLWYFKPGEDLYERMRLSYRPEMREQGPIVRAVSTRAP